MKGPPSPPTEPVSALSFVHEQPSTLGGVREETPKHIPEADPHGAEVSIGRLAVVMLNDDDTAADLVVEILSSCFGHDPYLASQLMMAVDQEGEAVVAVRSDAEARKIVAAATRLARSHGSPLEVRLRAATEHEREE